MGHSIYLATGNGVAVTRQRDGVWRAAGRGLAGRTVRCLAARGNAILAGTTEGVYRSEDGGGSWEQASGGLDVRHVRWMATSTPGVVYAGTEPAVIYRSVDGGHNWSECPRVAELRDHHQWFLPYSPEAGCVRGFAFHGERAYAAAEVGGVLRSDDGGETWDLAEGNNGAPESSRPPTPLVHPDVHSIHVHPSSPDRVLAATGGGLYASEDGGATWTLLYACYCRAAWLDPANVAHIVFGPADGVSRHGRIEETHDGGATWQPASGSLSVPWERRMVERFAPLGDDLIAVLSSGHLLAAPLSTLAWRRILPQVGDVKCALLA